jgi:predicted amidohydrolase
MSTPRPPHLSVAALQLPLGSWDEAANIAAVSALVEQAAADGAQVILPPELFSGPISAPWRTRRCSRWPAPRWSTPA